MKNFMLYSNFILLQMLVKDDEKKQLWLKVEKYLVNS